MKRDKELMRAILNWLLEHENEWQKVNTCVDEFRNYIYDENGNFLIGGEIVSNFIKNADKLLYGKDNYIMVNRESEVE